MIVFFDCDSTLSRIEGIDELAARAGVGAQVEELTRQAMEGELCLEEVYARRLEAVRPDRAALDWLGRRYVETLVDGAGEVFEVLAGRGDQVHVVSGGLQGPVRALARHLGAPAARVHAVPLLLDSGGAYLGFDEDCPLARADGKAQVCQQLLEEARSTMGRAPRSAMIGDGITDMEAGAVCDLIIGFGGVVARAAVRAVADEFVEGPSLRPVLALLGTAFPE